MLCWPFFANGTKKAVPFWILIRFDRTWWWTILLERIKILSQLSMDLLDLCWEQRHEQVDCHWVRRKKYNWWINVLVWIISWFRSYRVRDSTIACRLMKRTWAGCNNQEYFHTTFFRLVVFLFSSLFSFLSSNLFFSHYFLLLLTNI